MLQLNPVLFFVINFSPFCHAELVSASYNFHIIFWSLEKINTSDFKTDICYTGMRDNINKMQELYGFDLHKYNLTPYKKRQILRNCLEPEISKYIFNKIIKNII